VTMASYDRTMPHRASTGRPDLLKTIRHCIQAATSAAGRILVIAALALGVQPPQAALAQRTPAAPEGATGYRSQALAVANRMMVVAANPYAADAGFEILKAGGSAVDAAIAVQLVLGLVEPQSSGLGGGAFLLTWDNQRREMQTYDGRETAPAAAKPDRFLIDGKPMGFGQAVASGLSVGTPGLVRLLDLAHQKHGRLPWARLFEPAIRLAEAGFQVSPRLNALLAEDGPARFQPSARAYFFDAEGKPRAVGSRLANPEYAATLRLIADARAAAFYAGPLAEAVVAAVRAAPVPGDLALADFASYRVIERAPVCTKYRMRTVCGMGPPSSGGHTVAQVLALLEPFDLGRGPRAQMNAHALHLIAEAQKLAFADRDRYLADPDFVAIPEGLLAPAYLETRRAAINPARAMGRVQPGTPPLKLGQVFGEDATYEVAGTSHMSLVDADGNAVAMTTTIESGFGSGIWAAGFLLNNQLTDFSFRPADAAGRPVANRIEPGKRPRSSMAPTLVFDASGQLEAVLGAPGGSRIILYVLKTLVALIDWQLDPQAAIALANFGSRGGPFEFEHDARLLWPGWPWDVPPPAGLWGERSALWPALQMTARGHVLQLDRLNSGTHAIVRRKGRLEGGADPRREGVARGE